MKMNIKNTLLIVVTTLFLSSCIGDLNTIPINDSDVTSETAYGKEELAYVQGLTKIYAQFVTNDVTNLVVDDGGSSELIRTFWSTQEVTTDACKAAWGNDSWCQDLNNNRWTAEQNHMIYSVYVRTLQGITFANEYLRQTSEDKLSLRGVDETLAAKIAGFRAEARFLRAYFYWMAFDSFGNVPFSTEDSQFGGGYNPPQTERKEVFEFVVSELEELVADGSAMPAAQSNYPRADKGSCLGLLARLYLNAEVYTKTDKEPGTPMWEEAKATCEKIYGLGYSICPDYAALFRGDNGENAQAKNEFLFAAAYHNQKTHSYGGTSFLTLASTQSSDVNNQPFYLNGVNGGWAGIRVPFNYVQKYFDVKNQDYTFDPGNALSTQDNLTRDLGYDVVDNRGKLFYIYNRQENMDDLYSYTHGWSCFKFNNVPHDKSGDEFAETASTTTFSDIDFPLIRLGEIHLIYAEACMHLGQQNAALPKIAELAERAGITAVSSIDQDWLVAERARELMWEGHRRTDLIRYGLFSSDSFLWPYKGGSPQGQGFDSYRNIFAIPEVEMSSNLDLVQNPGYAD
ncbi:MAG: RagB/SusD family nutrient uptake outer membrane protein [Bacteroidales bacterium]|nr:RagB/SusD family nutrient uptake outer membrane protein [Bacteroidales bacterium]